MQRAGHCVYKGADSNLTDSSTTLVIIISVESRDYVKNRPAKCNATIITPFDPKDWKPLPRRIPMADPQFLRPGVSTQKPGTPTHYFGQFYAKNCIKNWIKERVSGIQLDPSMDCSF